MSDNNNTDTTKTPLGIDTSFVAFAHDAAENLSAVIDAEKPQTSGYLLLAYTDKGDDVHAAFHAKVGHLVKAICDTLEKDRTMWQLFEKVMDELERRMEAKGHTSTDTKSNNPINNNQI